MSSQSSALLAAIEELDACPAAQATEVLRWVSASNPDAARKAAEGLLQALSDNATACDGLDDIPVSHAPIGSIQQLLMFAHTYLYPNKFKFYFFVTVASAVQFTRATEFQIVLIGISMFLPLP